ncbi:Uncharacterised protein g8479 [Pycnogonum litorale]
MLNSPSVIGTLKKYFVSSWSLRDDLKLLSINRSNVEVADVASSLLQDYTFPVVIYVVSPDGHILQHVNINLLLDESSQFSSNELNIRHEDSDSKIYNDFLLRGVKIWEQSG